MRTCAFGVPGTSLRAAPGATCRRVVQLGSATTRHATLRTVAGVPGAVAASTQQPRPDAAGRRKGRAGGQQRLKSLAWNATKQMRRARSLDDLGKVYQQWQGALPDDTEGVRAASSLTGKVAALCFVNGYRLLKFKPRAVQAAALGADGLLRTAAQVAEPYFLRSARGGPLPHPVLIADMAAAVAALSSLLPRHLVAALSVGLSDAVEAAVAASAGHFDLRAASVVLASMDRLPVTSMGAREALWTAAGAELDAGVLDDLLREDAEPLQGRAMDVVQLLRSATRLCDTALAPADADEPSSVPPLQRLADVVAARPHLWFRTDVSVAGRPGNERTAKLRSVVSGLSRTILHLGGRKGNVGAEILGTARAVHHKNVRISCLKALQALAAEAGVQFAASGAADDRPVWPSDLSRIVAAMARVGVVDTSLLSATAAAVAYHRELLPLADLRRALVSASMAKHYDPSLWTPVVKEVCSRGTAHAEDIVAILHSLYIVGDLAGAVDVACCLSIDEPRPLRAAEGGGLRGGGLALTKPLDPFAAEVAEVVVATATCGVSNADMYQRAGDLLVRVSRAAANADLDKPVDALCRAAWAMAAVRVYHLPMLSEAVSALHAAQRSTGAADDSSYDGEAKSAHGTQARQLMQAFLSIDLDLPDGLAPSGVEPAGEHPRVVPGATQSTTGPVPLSEPADAEWPDVITVIERVGEAVDDAVDLASLRLGDGAFLAGLQALGASQSAELRPAAQACAEMLPEVVRDLLERGEDGYSAEASAEVAAGYQAALALRSSERWIAVQPDPEPWPSDAKSTVDPVLARRMKARHAWQLGWQLVRVPFLELAKSHNASEAHRTAAQNLVARAIDSRSGGV